MQSVSDNISADTDLVQFVMTQSVSEHNKPIYMESGRHGSAENAREDITQNKTRNRKPMESPPIGKSSEKQKIETDQIPQVLPQKTSPQIDQVLDEPKNEELAAALETIKRQNELIEKLKRDVQTDERVEETAKTGTDEYQIIDTFPLVEQKGAMAPWDHSRIRSNMEFLIKELDPNVVKTPLYSKYVLDDKDVEEIDALPTPRAKNERILYMLMKRGKDAYKIFLKILETYEYRYAIKRLEPQSADKFQATETAVNSGKIGDNKVSSKGFSFKKLTEADKFQATETAVNSGKIGDNKVSSKGFSFKKLTEDLSPNNDFITPSLIDQLRRLLEQYSYDQILKELIQNAEDSGATKVKFVFVQKHHAPEEVKWKNSPILYAMKGPALCVMNDGMFSNADWKGIASLQGSPKENDPLKIGQFGLGFKSVFHITDNPVIVSGLKVMVMNPQAKKNRAPVFDLRNVDREDQMAMLNLMDGICGFSEEIFQNGYQGSLFWFPLRSKVSELSSETYDERKIKDIFNGFKLLAPSILLFLKQIESIELFEKKNQVHKLFEVSFVGDKDDMINIGTKKRDFRKEIQNFKGKLAPSAVALSLKFRVHCKGFAWMEHSATEEDWVIVDYYHGDGGTSELKNFFQSNPNWLNSPYVSVGVRLSKPVLSGNIFCFLPLPFTKGNKTGLPFHVNGFFSLSQDRHHLKWTSESEDHRSHAEKAVQWNQLMIKEIFPHAFAEVIRQLTDESLHDIDKDQLYALLPNRSKVSEDWISIIYPVYQHLYSLNCIYTKNRQGRWICPTEAVFADHGMSSTIEDIYILHDINIAKVKEYIVESFEEHGDLKHASSEELKVELLKQGKYQDMNPDQKINLLLYFLDQKSTLLEDLKLLPLADGTFTTFTKDSNAQRIYICGADIRQKMFPNMEAHFVEFGLQQGLERKLLKLSEEGMFKLKVFQPEDLCELLEVCLIENGWEDDKTLTPALSDWLLCVWNYINNLSEEKEQIIKNVKNLYLLPWINGNGKGEIKTLNGISILESHSGVGSLNAEVSKALENLGIVVFKTLPQTVTECVAGWFVQYPTDSGLMRCLHQISRISEDLEAIIENFNFSSTDEEKHSLVIRLSSVQDIAEVKGLIRKLELFTTISNKQTCLEKVDVMYVEDNTHPKIPIKPEYEVIYCSDDYTKIVAEKCGVKLLSFDSMMERVLIHLNCSYTLSEKRQFMVYFMKNFHLFEKRISLVNLAKQIEFVENESLKYKRPSDLFNPDSELLQNLFQIEQDRFPKKCEFEISDLKKLGLRHEKDVTDPEIIHTAEEIERQYHENNQNSSVLLEVSLALSKFLTKHHTRLLPDTIRILESCTCFPIAVQRRPNYPVSLKFIGEGEDYTLKKPCEMFSSEDAHLIGAVAYIARETMQPCFRLKPLTNEANLVARQLIHVSENYCDKEFFSYMTLIEDIYHHLDSQDYADLKGKKVVWTGEKTKFQMPETVWIQLMKSPEIEICLEPYMYSLPNNMIKLADWFESIGCKKIAQQDDLNKLMLSMLHQIKRKYDSNCSSVMSSKKEVQKDLTLVLEIINTFTNLTEDFPGVGMEILLPVRTKADDILLLKFANECTVFEDSQEYYDDDDENEADRIYFVHPTISLTTAKRFCVPFLSQRILDQTDFLDMNFGQKEPLTTRIKNLLKDYSDGFTIPKELIQNADDAGATVVKFLYDERTLDSAQTFLFHEGMVPCQGPAFWAYNDAQFSSDDFENITKLAGATKMEDSLKIGRFGLGFSSVYNLTDVPSFISGETYVVFDPHENHLGKSGLKLNLNHPCNRRLRKKMKGQFVPFEGVFNCTIGDSKSKVNFDGTLFRFPLRNRSEALKSKIKEFSYSSEEMEKFLGKIEEGAGNLLMFTQNVVKVELYHLDERSDVPTKLMTVSRSSDNSGTTVLKKLKDMQSELVKDIEKPTPQIMEEIRIQLSTKETENSKAFLISWSYGIGKALSEAEKPAFKGLLPVAATAIQSENHSLSVDRQKVHGFYPESHLFCFLPLPVKSELPVHLNASFAVLSSRKELAWRNEDELLDSAEDKWNKVLLEDAGSQSYIHMLTRIAQLETRPEPQNYYNLWPSMTSTHKHDQILSHHIYLTICEGNYNVFLTPQFDVVSLKQSFFLDPKLREDTTVGTIAFKALQNFLKSLKREQVHLIDLPLSIWENFEHAECLTFLKEYVISIEEFYSIIIFPHLLDSYWLKEDLYKILLYGLNNGSKDLLILFSNHECIPTKPNGKLARPSKLIHPKGELAKLFSESEECFPEEIQLLSASFNSSQSLKQLESLGMQVNEFSDWELLSERIYVALESGGYEHIKERCINILRYLSSPCTRQGVDQISSRYKVCPDHVREKISSLRFLPRLSICQKYAWCKKTNTSEFISATEGYLPELIDLVGCILPIVDTEDFKYRILSSIEVLKWLGVGQKTDVQSVVGNLLQISHEYIKSEPSSSDMFYALEKSVLKMYDYILSDTNDEVNTYIVEKLSNAAVILQDTTMKKPQEMALNLLSDLSPYLYTISPRYKKYSDFFCLIGVTEKLTISKILQVLVSISNDKGSEELSDAEITCMVHLTEPLPELLRHNVDSQLINLPDNKIDSQLIKLPDNENKLTPIKDLWFDDTPWLKHRSKNIKPLHEKFTQCVARSMGVQSKRDHAVNWLSKSDKFFQFGQHEDLTNRIHRILEGYPRDESILKEILQNADDAGATEVIFIKDFRNLPTKSLPNEEWSDMQGPALCVYNDSYFTEQDLKGIQDLGIGTKRSDVLKTGQFGVGFNVVYHITDAPSFWSKGGKIGEVVCVFDPHCKYVTMATEEKPGMMIDAKDLNETFADFHTGYLPMLTRDKTQGTLFRLPLRTKEMALSSKISDEVSREHIEEVIELLKDQLFSSMIFLENIKKVKIGSIVGEELVIEYEVASTMSGEDVSKQKDYNDYLKMIAMKIKQKEGDAFSTTPKEISITLQITDNMKKKEDYLIVKRAGFLTDSPFPEKLQNAYENGQVQKLPRGGVAIVLSQNSKIKGKAYCTLPLPVKTGLPVHVNGQFALDHESRRNLWKGEDSVQFLWNWLLGKSLIVPAYISALQKYKLYPLPARQCSMKTTDLIQMIQQFESLFPKKRDASDIYWKDLVESIYDKIAKYRFSLFPVILDNTSHWCEINWVPVQIDDDFAGCFNTLDQYYKLKNTTQDATFFRSSSLSPQMAHSKNAEGTELTHQLEELEKILVTLGMKVLKSASWIRQEIEGAKTVSPELVLKFLKSHANQGQPNGCILGELPEHINKTTFKTVANLKIVFEFVMKAIEQEYSQNSSQKKSKSLDFLYGAPLLLQQNHQLSVFREDSIITVSKFCDLLPDYSNRFLSLDILPILEDYVSVYPPLKEWSIAEFASWCNGTDLHSFIGQGTVVSWSGGKPVSEPWLVMLWKFLNHHILNSPDDSGSISLESHLNPVESFSILPVEIASNTFRLYPLSHAERVIDYVHLSFYDMCGILVLEKTEKILKNLRFPNLHHLHLDPPFKYRACEIVADMKHPVQILEVLYTNSNCLASIDTQKAQSILQYFNMFNKEILACQNKLKHLKLYETHDGKLITLDMPKKYIRLLDSYPKVPSNGLQDWSSESNVIILKRHSKLDDLFKTIGIDNTSPIDLYLKYILKWFSGFKDEDQLYHLKYIRDNLLTKMEQDFKPKREALIQMLTEVKFISYRSGKTVASSFYDNENEVFQVMHELLDFPPPPFNDPTWKEFLIHAGLIFKVSEENFVFFAETIAKVALSNGVTDKLKNQSQVLVNYLFDMNPNNNKSICTRIKSIKFLEQERLQDDDYRIKISSQFGSCRNFIAFQDSYDYSLFDLIWSVKYVLKIKTCELARRNEFYVDWFKLLGISKTVDSTTFIRNMENVCSSLTDKSVPNKISLDDQKKLFGTYYQFLQDKLSEVREELMDLKDYHTIFLPDDELLVPATSVLLESSPDCFINGHIFKAPIYYGKYFDLFEALGVRKSAIPDIYVKVLCDIEENCNGEKLDPNESVAVQKCIKQLNILWKKHADQKYELKNLILFLPNQQNVLKNSTELVFIDDDYIYHRTKQLCIDFFIGYKCLEMEVPDPNSLHRFWPKEYQMKRLSEIVKERLNQDCIQGAVYGELANEVCKKLKHDAMLEALLRLLKHDQHKAEMQFDDDETMKKKLQTIIDIKVFEVKNLSMELVYQENVVPNSECKKSAYFLKSSQQNKSTKDYILYVNQGISVEDYGLKKTLFALLKQILNISIQEGGMLFSALWSMNHSEIPEFLNSRNIIHSNYDAVAPSIFPDLGTEIPKDLHFLLNNAFSEFYDGEYVGFEVFDPDLEETKCEDVEYSPMYVYAKIVKKVKAETDEEFATFSINVGEDHVIEVYFFKIYKFHRTQKSKSRALELSEKMNEDNSAESSQDITSILQGIRKTLMKAWKLPEKERKTILKRLILLWHPDKNLHNQKMATEITQKIFMYVNRLKNDLSLDELDETDGQTSSSNYYSGDDSYGYFYKNMHSRGRSYARNFQDYCSDDSYYHHHSWIRTEPRPMPDQAVRWLRQAVSDLKAAELFQQTIGDNFHNWVCYKCQQAAEKALKAVWYTIDGNKVTRDHNVYQVAYDLPYDNLKTLALELQNMIGNHTRMRYPDTLSYPQIPNDVYNKDHSQRGCEIAEKIVNGASEIINSNYSKDAKKKRT